MNELQKQPESNNLPSQLTKQNKLIGNWIKTEAELAAARRAAGSGVRIVPVATLADALAALRANGGAALDEPGI
jgi:hypothetical protein